MATAQKQHAIRRSTRLPLEIPVEVSSTDAAQPFSAPGKTTLVNAHGCGLILERAVPNGINVRIEIVSSDRHTTGRVAEIVPLGGDPETWLLGVELDHPGNFWGIEYAPSDWKIDEAAVAPEQGSQEALKARAAETPAKNAAARRWRLTDISAGGCYLETASPMPVGTCVLVSIRVAKSECLLDGIVRASHPDSGIGVEFVSHSQAHVQRVKDLISLLTEHREVPRVFVGRKEGGHEGNVEPVSGAEAVSAADPLLELIRQGESLPVDQFLDSLKAQRLGKRSESRTEMSLILLLTGTDIHGRPLDQQVTTLNVSKRGALLAGVHGRLRPGDTIFLSRGSNKEEFRVAWVGAESPAADQVGVVAVQSRTALWDHSPQNDELSFETGRLRKNEASR